MNNVLNDRPDLAMACHADGVHIGQDDGSIKKIREQVGEEMIIGASCHDGESAELPADEGIVRGGRGEPGALAGKAPWIRGLRWMGLVAGSRGVRA